MCPDPARHRSNANSPHCSPTPTPSLRAGTLAGSSRLGLRPLVGALWSLLLLTLTVHAQDASFSFLPQSPVGSVYQSRGRLEESTGQQEGELPSVLQWPLSPPRAPLPLKRRQAPKLSTATAEEKNKRNPKSGKKTFTSLTICNKKTKPCHLL